MAHALGDGGPWFLRSAAGERVVQAHEIEEVLA
jgi:hypothetical protein